MSSKRILVIEDSGTFRTVVRIALQRSGYEVFEAATAEAACEMLDGRDIRLVVSDLNLPGMDGLGFVRHLRTTPYKFTPVIMLTTESQQGKKTEAADVGIKVWITKPFQPSYLIETIKTLCPA
ncbi:MAG: response regulator [Aquabacterium sp.]